MIQSSPHCSPSSASLEAAQARLAELEAMRSEITALEVRLAGEVIQSMTSGTSTVSHRTAGRWATVLLGDDLQRATLTVR